MLWLSFLLIVQSIVQIQSQETYSIVWSEVPSAATALSIASDAELGPCICDMTAGTCDANCKCDPECSETEKATFSSALNEGPVSYSVTKCVDDTELAEVNIRGGLTYSVIKGALCVAKDNNPSHGYFFEVPSPIPATDAFITSQRAALSYSYQPDDSVSASTTSTEASYKVGEAIGAATFQNGEYIRSHSGYLVVPAPNERGICSDVSFMKYLEPVSARTCMRVIASSLTESVCVGSSSSVSLFSSTPYTNNIKVAVYKSDSPSTWINLNVRSITYPNSTMVNGTLLTVPSPSYTSSSCTCTNVLKKIHFVVARELGGTLSSVFADVTLGSVSGLENSVCGPAVLQQTFSTTFNLTGSLSAVRPKSGNPGYRLGYPVLAGKLISSNGKYAVSQLVNGLQLLPRDSAGHCLSPSSITSSMDSTLLGDAVRFGQNMHSSCLLPLTAGGLSSICGSTTVLWDYLKFQTTHLGVFGNADFTEYLQWIPIYNTTVSYSTAYDSPRRTCPIVYNSVDIEIVTAAVGSIGNPQQMILAARRKFSRTTWRMQTSETNVTEYFPLTATVTFISVQPDAYHEYVPGAPTMAKMPHDILYPFSLDSGTHAAASFGFVSLIAYMILCLFFL
eukprot:TRINITY_DN1406_c0_g1_i1.p1 TRINITY_DN1406_c0_g1~~TRINITY_DN1406_c0_g1_i1.p1  ORF type:complete len:620 (+),score=102.91 TRINITY_DN1406_c0_g1_i1:69-1928(+)